MTRAAEVYSRRPFRIADLNTSIDGEPRMLDVRLAEVLEFSRPRDIRKIVERNSKELQSFGILRHVAQNHNGGRGRPSMEFWLNKKQALYITAKSDTPAAAMVTIQMVEVFDAYTAGELVAIDKPIDVRNHTRRTSTKVDDALRLKKNIDRLESVVATIQPTQPNFCAMVIDGEPVFVDVNSYTGAGRAVVIGHDGQLRIEQVEPNTMGFRPFGARTALGERYPGPHGGTARNSLVVVGMVMEPNVDRQSRVDHVTDRLRGQIMTLLESVPWSDRQIATELRCNPKLVREVRRIQSRKPSDKPPMRQIEHEPRTVAPYRDRVIAMIQQGYGNAEIARTLGCHVHTVERRRNLMRDQARKLLS